MWKLIFKITIAGFAFAFIWDYAGLKLPIAIIAVGIIIAATSVWRLILQKEQMDRDEERHKKGDG